MSNTSIKRLQDGIADIAHHDDSVVTTDAVALLSGVNFATVERVIAALYIIQKFSDTPAESLIDFAAVPINRVHPDNPEDSYRTAVTREFCEDLVASGQFKTLQYVLPRLQDYFKQE